MFFVYVDCKPDGTPFYVGKGLMNRVYQKYRKNVRHQRICQKYPNWYRGLAFMGNEKEALAKEIELIAKYKDTLANLTDGGEGTVGLAKDETWKTKLSNSAKKQWARVGMKEKMTAKIKEAHTNPKTKEKMRLSAVGRDMNKSALAPYICLECGKITNSRGINYHQKDYNHIGKEKL